MDYIIQTDSLTKSFGNKAAVDKVSLHVGKGEIYGLIGKNGAGKTTLMRLLLGLSNPNSGEMKLYGGSDLNKARRTIGSLIEEPALYKNETALENLRRFAILVPTPDEDLQKLLELVGLGNVGNKKAGRFSLGMRQRLGLAIALLGNPDIMILDEPINGLDPAGIKEIRDIILELNKKGVTFLISSHLLDELGRIATKFGIMSDGVLTDEITKEELEARRAKWQPREPKVTLNHFAVLTVKEVTKIGAFLDWGLEKDLFLPYREMKGRVEPGDEILARLYIDKSGRLAASMRGIFKLLSHHAPYSKGDMVTGRVYEFGYEFGTFVAVDDQYDAMIPKFENTRHLRIGDVVDLRVTGVKEDGKLDVSMRKSAVEEIPEDAQKVLDLLASYAGVLPFSEKASPEVIFRETGMSKNAFKRAVGHLYKERKVTIDNGKIRLA